jgi:hypothetical protein
LASWKGPERAETDLCPSQSSRTRISSGKTGSGSIRGTGEAGSKTSGEACRLGGCTSESWYREGGSDAC